jgi:hypothetical protein
MIGFGHWQMSIQWPAVVYDVAPWPEYAPAFISPRARRTDSDCGWPTSYAYSSSFIARPDVWRAGSQPNPRLLSATFTHEVQFPSSKVLAWDWELAYIPRSLKRSGPDLDEATPMLFADGHGAMRIPAAGADPSPNPFPGALYPAARLHNTPDGVYGRDY